MSFGVGSGLSMRASFLCTAHAGTRTIERSLTMLAVIDEDVITVKDVARVIKKSPGWCYKNAAVLGASKIGGSLIFRLSAVIEALESHKLKRESASTGKPARSPHPTKTKKSKSNPYKDNLDPGRHGIQDILSGGFGAFADWPGDVFEGIDLDEAIREFRLQ